ncbi:MAG: hypothetical protein AABX16_01740 [Nanoarchaeota archaeon]
MKTIEANIVLSFAQVRKDIFNLEQELESLRATLSQLNKLKKTRK